MNRHEETFRSQFLPVFLTLAVLAGLVGGGALWLTDGSDIDPIGAAVAGGILVISASLWTRRLIARYPVLVSPGGLRAYGLRGGLSGDEHWLEWAAITRVSRFSLLSIRCLVLRTHHSTRRYWIPLHVVEARRFRDMVNAYAGRTHPVTRVLYD